MYWHLFKLMLISDIKSIIRGRERELSCELPRKIAKEENQNSFVVYLKMLYSVLHAGCTFKEYYNLNFIKRSLNNQKTFITSGSNLIAYGKVNDAAFNHVYINKDEFNTIYADYLSRDWMKLSEERSQIIDFFKQHNSVIIKPRAGDSGKGIFVIHSCSSLHESEIDRIITENKNGIIEEILQNHPDISVLNPTSLNTLRIITVRNGEKLDILFAGIRYGAKGSEVDNISQGGYIAPIDIKSGRISGLSYRKKTISDQHNKDEHHIGLQIPLWDELYEYLMDLTSVVPQMKYMAWDIAITDNGFATIEGNHSSGNTVIQTHLGIEQEGLKTRLDQLIQEML